MANVANLQVGIGADTTGLEKGINDAKKEVGLLGNASNEVGYKLKSAFGIGAVVAIAVMAIKQFTTDVFKLSVSSQNVNKLNTEFDELKSTIADKLSPALNSFAEKLAARLNTTANLFTKLKLELKELAGTITKDELSLLISDFASPKKELGKIEKLKQLIEALEQQKLSANTEERITEINKSLKGLNDELKRLNELGTKQPIDIKVNLKVDKEEAQKLEDWMTNPNRALINYGWDKGGMSSVAQRTGLEGEAPGRLGKGTLFSMAENMREITAKNQEEAREAGATLGDQFSQGMKSAIASGIEGLAEVVGTGLATGFKDLGKNALQILGSFAKQIGGLLIALGTAGLTVKSGSWLYNPAVAIGVGASLVAIGAALSAAAHAGPGKSGGGGGYSSGFSSGGSAFQPASIRLEAILKGKDIYLTNQRYANSLVRGT